MSSLELVSSHLVWVRILVRNQERQAFAYLVRYNFVLDIDFDQGHGLRHPGHPGQGVELPPVRLGLSEEGKDEIGQEHKGRDSE